MKSVITRGQKGQGLVEYALILVLVAIVVIAALMVLGPIISNTFTSINDSLSTVGGPGSCEDAVAAHMAAHNAGVQVGTPEMDALHDAEAAACY